MTTDTLGARLRALAEAAEACDGRVDPDAVRAARHVVERAGRRLALSGDATVVALAGATGSGKSSLFNALSGADLAEVGVRRPTTSEALACTWGVSEAEALLDWVGVRRRHALAPEALAPELDGLVLLDLPDHDSTEVSHRLEVDRLVDVVDALIWVVDPQKYADGVLHERYLRPLARHREVMMVVLNQADRLDAADRERCLQDLRRLLDEDGLTGVAVVAASALTTYGLPELRRHLTTLVAGKQAAVRRLAADVSVVAERLAEASGQAPAPEVARASRDRLSAALAEAAGVPAVVDAVAHAWRRRGALATGWPALAWLSRFRPDPLRRLGLRSIGAGRGQAELPVGTSGVTSRTSLPVSVGVQQSRVDMAVRAYADAASTGLARGWADAIKAAARRHGGDLPDALDRAVSRADLDLHRRRRWWAVVRVVQWLLLGVVVVGLGWLAADLVLAYLQLPPLPGVGVQEVPLPTLFVFGGVVAGLVLAGLSRIGVGVGARRRSAVARKVLRRAIAQVSADLVVGPVVAERERYDRARAALETACGTQRSRSRR